MHGNKVVLMLFSTQGNRQHPGGEEKFFAAHNHEAWIKKKKILALCTHGRNLHSSIALGTFPIHLFCHSLSLCAGGRDPCWCSALQTHLFCRLWYSKPNGLHNVYLL